MFPAVALFTEGASKLLGMGSMALTTLAPAQIFHAHLFLQMLLKTCLVGKLSEAVGTLERAVMAVVGCLGVIVQKPLLGEVLAAVIADKRAFAGVYSIVDVEVGLASVSFGADATDKRFFTRVHSDVLLQGVVVIAGLVAERAHEVRRAGVGGHVRPQG